jgi:hypothetical protein
MIAMIFIPAAHGVVVVLAVKVVSASVLIFPEFLFLMAAATPMAMVLILGKSLAAANREYGRDEHV